MDYDKVINKWYEYYNEKYKKGVNDDYFLTSNIIKHYMDIVYNDKEMLNHYMDVYKFVIDYLYDKHDKNMKFYAGSFTERFVHAPYFFDEDFFRPFDENEIGLYFIGFVLLEKEDNIRNFNKELIYRILSHTDKDTICKIIAYFKYVWDYGNYNSVIQILG